MKIAIILGTRPEIIKMSPVIRELEKRQVVYFTLHTGQHYSYNLDKVFFEQLNLPQAKYNLEVSSGSHAEQTAKILIGVEQVLQSQNPDIVLVEGDTNSVLAGALAAVKLNTSVAHVEAGLRSYDRAMPEEINRLLTDQISDYLFTPSPDANENLKKEGVPKEKIFLVGNVMVDSLLFNKDKADQSTILSRLKLAEKGYALLTLHRPGNVDEKHSLTNIMGAITEISGRIPVVFPAHPRTQKKLREFGVNVPATVITNLDELDRHSRFNERLLIIPPLGYLDFLKLEMYARLVMTDSGGIQEETTVLSVPCLTLRDTTERPITITQGTNTIVGSNRGKIIEEASRILVAESQSPPQIELWDGAAAERIVDIFTETK